MKWRTLLVAFTLAAIAMPASPATEVGSRTQTPEEIARAHLKRQAPGLTLRQGVDDLTHESTQESPGAYHVQFQQTFLGVPIFGAHVKVNISKARNEPTMVLNRGRPNARAPTRVQNFGPTNARAIAEAAIGASQLRGPVAESQILFPIGKDLLPAWQFVIPSLSPLGDWLVIVRADSGQVVLRQNLLAHDTGRVFDPNPVVTGAPVPPPPPADCDSPAAESQLSAEYRTRTLLGILAGQDKLKGQYVDLTAPGIVGGYKAAGQANEASRNYVYPCNDDRFEEVMVYYHLDWTQRRIQSLGFTGALGILDSPIPAHAHYFADCNAFYSAFDGGLHFGDGCPGFSILTDSAEDADVIIHEYGHAIHDDQVPSWGLGTPLAREEALAMGEGFGDFLAAVMTGSPCLGEWFDNGGIACAGQPGLRYLQNGKVYPTDFEACPQHLLEPERKEEHCAGEIWGATLWDLAEALGNDAAARDLALKLVLASHYYLDPVSTFSEAACAIRQADSDLYGGAHLSAITGVFLLRGINCLGSTADFPYAYLRIRHTFVGDLVVSLKAGPNPASPLCNILLWNRDGAGDDDLLMRVGLAPTACAPYLAPTTAVPWWLGCKTWRSLTSARSRNSKSFSPVLSDVGRTMYRLP
jgi:Zn-dependent metalloprotease